MSGKYRPVREYISKNISDGIEEYKLTEEQKKNISRRVKEHQARKEKTGKEKVKMNLLKKIAAVLIATVCVTGVIGVIYTLYAIKPLHYLFIGAGLVVLIAGLSVLIYQNLFSGRE